MKKHMSFTATGDSLIVKRLPEGYPGRQELTDFIRRAETRITNLETTLTHGECFPSSFSGGGWVTADPSVLEDLKAFGFNMYGCANNHTMDYSYDGLLSTVKYLDEAGLAHCGSGKNLYEACRPGILDLPSGRVGMISLSSNFDPSARAGMQTAMLPGRPGLNPLRYRTVYRVTGKHMDMLKEVAAATQINGKNELLVQYGFKQPVPENRFEMLNLQFEEVASEEEEGRFTSCNPLDIQRTVRVIKDSLLTMDYVAVMVHSHEIKTNSYEQADYFFEEFAHACIDAGACAVIGGGTHQLKGIEIYKGRPIFYSLGNFIFTNECLKVTAPEYMEDRGLPLDMTAAESWYAALEKNHARSINDDPNNYMSVIPYFEMEDDRCVKLELLPISLGLNKPFSFKSIPYPADEAETEQILIYLKRVCAEYGTELRLENGRIRVVLPE